MTKQRQINLTISAGLFVLYAITTVIQIFCIKSFNTVAILETFGTLAAITALFSGIKIVYYLCFSLFAMLAPYGGAMLRLYDILPSYDIIMHLLSGIMIVFTAHYFFTLLLSRCKYYNIPIICGIVISFLTGLATTSVWEIYEFTIDSIFGFNCQLGSLYDTMTDIISGALGAFVGAVLLTAYIIKTVGKRYIK